MTTPDHPDTADVYLVNSQQCSAGTGPGYATGLPWDEAKALVDAGYAIYGTSPFRRSWARAGRMRPP